MNNNNKSLTTELNKQLLGVNFNEVNFNLLDHNDNINNIKLNTYSKNFLELLISTFPEWKNIIGKKQHLTHHYTLDIHTLLVIKTLNNDINFINLSEEEKLILLYTSLFHDAAKKEKVVDFEHPQKSAELTDKLFNKYKFNIDHKQTIIELIENHQVIGWLASDKITLKEILSKPISNPPIFYKLLKIFTLADIKSVQKNHGFYKEHIKISLNNATELLYKEIKHIK